MGKHKEPSGKETVPFVTRHRAEMDEAMRHRRVWFVCFLGAALIALLIYSYGIQTGIFKG